MTPGDAALVHADENASDEAWFAHYRTERERLFSVQGRAGTQAYMARRSGDMIAYRAWRTIESAAGVSAHAANTAVLSGEAPFAKNEKIGK